MMEDTAGRTMVRAAMKAPYLERDEEHTLALRWKEDNDQQALHQITVANMRLVISMASRFRHYGLPRRHDQEGHVGLLAQARFEPEREVRFSTYATWWIRASMQDYSTAQLDVVRWHQFGAEGAVLQPAAPAPGWRKARTDLDASLITGFGGARRFRSRRGDDGFAPSAPTVR
jgi:RNA polymerase sigma-32 factor